MPVTTAFTADKRLDASRLAVLAKRNGGTLPDLVEHFTETRALLEGVA